MFEYVGHSLHSSFASQCLLSTWPSPPRSQTHKPSSPWHTATLIHCQPPAIRLLEPRPSSLLLDLRGTGLPFTGRIQLSDRFRSSIRHARPSHRTIHLLRNKSKAGCTPAGPLARRGSIVILAVLSASHIRQPPKVKGHSRMALFAKVSRCSSSMSGIPRTRSRSTLRGISPFGWLSFSYSDRRRGCVLLRTASFSAREGLQR